MGPAEPASNEGPRTVALENPDDEKSRNEEE
jgi:hypothetical protein